VEKKVGEVLGSDKVDAIVCVAGGWAGGNAASNSRYPGACDVEWHAQAHHSYPSCVGFQ